MTLGKSPRAGFRQPRAEEGDLGEGRVSGAVGRGSPFVKCPPTLKSKAPTNKGRCRPGGSGPRAPSPTLLDALSPGPDRGALQGPARLRLPPHQTVKLAPQGGQRRGQPEGPSAGEGTFP